MPLPRNTLLFDGDCGFCDKSVRLFHRIVRRPVTALPSSTVDLTEALRDQSLREIKFVTASGEVLGGVDAIAAALAAGDRPVLAWLVRNAPFGKPIYRAIARSRKTLTCPAVRPGSPAPPSAPAPPDCARN